MRTAVAAFTVVALLVALGGSTPVPQVAAQAEGTVVGSPTLTAAAPDNRVQRGATRELSVVLANGGGLTRGGPERFEDRVTTARNVRVEVATDRLTEPLADALEVRTGPTVLGELPGSSARRVNLTLGVGRSLSPGQYELPLRVTYEYTSFVRFDEGSTPEYNDASRTLVLRVPLVVAERARLSVTDVRTSTLSAGDTGRLSFRVTNTGTVPAEEAALLLRVDDVAVHLGGTASAGPTTNLFVGELAPGESRTLTVTVGAYPGTAPGTYLVAMTAQYHEPGGFERAQDDLRVGVAVAAENESAERRDRPHRPPPVASLERGAPGPETSSFPPGPETSTFPRVTHTRRRR